MAIGLRATALAIMLVACTPFAGSNVTTDGGDTVDAGGSIVGGGTSRDAAAPEGGLAACPLEACNGRDDCQLFDFESGCPDDWIFAGDLSPTVVRECRGGKLRVAAEGTLDVTASLPLTLGGAARGSFSVLAAANVWDGRAFLALRVGSENIVELRAEQVSSDTIRYRWCESPDCSKSSTFDALAGEEHRITLEATDETLTMSVDCVPLGTQRFPALSSGPSAAAFVFGHVDADPIDGTIDEVVIRID